MRTWIWLLFLAFSTAAAAQVKVEDFRNVTNENNDQAVINAALAYLDSVGHGKLEFDGTRTYTVRKPLLLPTVTRTGRRRMFIIEGNGAEIIASKGINVFERVPKTQSEANKWMSTRFTIQNFSITGGDRAVFLCASYNSCIQYMNFTAQQKAAVEVQFGLQTRIAYCNSTNALENNFILTYGKAWEGKENHSQSNHSVIESSRVFARDGALTAFMVEASNGVVLRDNISEGSKNIRYSILFSKRNANTVKLFRVENFHLEHAPQLAGIFLYGDGIMEIDGLFYQLADTDWPLIHAYGGGGQISLSNIPHFVNGSVFLLEAGDSNAWKVVDCHPRFYVPSIYITKNKTRTIRKFPKYFHGILGFRNVGKTVVEAAAGN